MGERPGSHAFDALEALAVDEKRTGELLVRFERGFQPGLGRRGTGAELTVE
jgi:hypothetical protein